MAEKSPSAPRYGRSWQTEGVSSNGNGNRVVTGRAKRIFMVLAGLAALAGAVVGLLLLLGRNPVPTPHFLSIPITEYSGRPYPANPLARQDSDVLIRHFPGGEQVLSSQSKDLLLGKFRQLKGKKTSALVVHLSAFAVFWDDVVYILPADSSPDDISSWVPLRDVLDLVRDCPTKNKLLILDIMAPMADTRLGVTTNDVADHVLDELDALAEDDKLPFFVLCACSRGQVSHPCEELGQTGFGYYLDEGLRGHADGYDNKPDNRLSVRELAAFVRVRTQRWARYTLNEDQTPVLRGKANDFNLLLSDEKKPRDDQTFPAPQNYPDWLKEKWEIRDGFRKEQDYQTAPRLLRELEANLLQLEQAWLAGREESRIKDDLNRRVGPFADQMKTLKSVPGPGVRSLAQARGPKFKPDEETAKGLRSLFAVWDGKPPPDEKLFGPEKKKFIEEKIKPKQPTMEMLAAIFDTILEYSNPTQDKLQYLVEVLDALPLNGFPDLVEIHALRRLADANLGKLWTDKSKLSIVQAIKEALTAVHEGEMLTAACSPRVYPWIQTQVEPIDVLRRRYIQQLVKPQTGESVEARKLAEDLANTVQQYREIKPYLEGIQEAFRVYDESVGLLPLYYPYLVNLPLLHSYEDRSWKEAIQRLQALQGKLEEPHCLTPVELEELRNETNRVKHLMSTELGKAFEERRIKDLLSRTETGRGEHYREMKLVLSSPRLTANRRVELWKCSRRLAARLQSEVLELDEKDNDKNTRTETDLPENKPDPVERLRGLRRIRMTLDQLQLAGYYQDRKIEDSETRKEFDNATVCEETLQGLGVRTRDAQGTNLPGDFIQKQKNLLVAERLSQALYPLDFRKDHDADLRAAHPSARLRAGEMRKRWEALAKRYRDEVPGQPPKTAAFFESIAAEYESYAKP